MNMATSKNHIVGIKTILSNQPSKQSHIQRCMGMWMHDLSHLPCINLSPMALCMNMWINDMVFNKDIKTKPNLSVWL